MEHLTSNIIAFKKILFTRVNFWLKFFQYLIKIYSVVVFVYCCIPLSALLILSHSILSKLLLQQNQYSYFSQYLLGTIYRYLCDFYHVILLTWNKLLFVFPSLMSHSVIKQNKQTNKTSSAISPRPSASLEGAFLSHLHLT